MNFRRIISIILVISLIFGISASILAEESYNSDGVIWNIFYDGTEAPEITFPASEMHIEPAEVVEVATGPEVKEYYEYKDDKNYKPGALSSDIDFDTVGKGLFYDGDDFYFFTDTGIMATEFMQTIEGKRYYFGTDGKMVKNELVNYDGELYYFDPNGVMFRNRWVTIEYNDKAENDKPKVDYYFGPTGRAYRAPDNSNGIIIKTIDEDVFGFNSDAEKLEGYYDYMGNEYDPNDTEAYAYCDYYFDPQENGIACTGWHYYSGTVKGTEYDDNEEMLLYFDEKTCRKVKAKENDEGRCISRTIEGERYMFDSNGVRKNKWYKTEPGRGTYSNAKYFNDDEEGILQKGWFTAIPSKNSVLKENRDRNASSEEVWFYATSNGNVLKKTIRKIGTHTYAFDDDGVMLSDYMVKVKNGSYVKGYRVDDVNRGNVLFDVDEYGSAETEDYTNMDPKKGLLENGEQWLYFRGPGNTEESELLDGAMCRTNKTVKVGLKDEDIEFMCNSTGGYTNKNTDEIVIRNNKYIQNGVILKPNSEDNNYGLIRKSKNKEKISTIINFKNDKVEFSPEKEVYIYLLVNSQGAPLATSFRCIKDKQGNYLYYGRSGEFIGAYSVQGKNIGTATEPKWQHKSDDNKTWVDGLPDESYRVSDEYLWLNFNDGGYSKGPVEDGYASLMYIENTTP